MENNSLAHYGVLGMKWGVRKSTTSSSNSSGRKMSRKQKKALDKARKTRKANLEKAKAEAKAKQDYEAAKKKAIESGNASEVLKFKGKLTAQELQTALNRINLERQLSSISSQETKSGLDKVSDFMDKVDKANQAATKGINAWNTIAKISNSLTDSDLPVIDGVSKKDKAATSAREKLIKSGSAKEISKHFGTFTAKELEDINKRMNYEDRIRERVTKSEESKSKKTNNDAEDSGSSSSKKASTASTDKIVADDIIIMDAPISNRSRNNSRNNTIELGTTYVAGLLEPPKDDD